MAKFDLTDYVTVNERIAKFYEKYPNGTIQTEIIELKEGFVLMKANIYKEPEDQRPTTGHAYEVENASYINKTSFIENCETSCVGRALALLGLEISKSVASREEVETAINKQEAIKTQEETKKQATAPKNSQEQYKKEPKQEPIDPNLLVCNNGDCLEDITEKIYNYSVSRFGRALCYKCQKKQG